ncbi:PriCT-2 domain-containing protein, partial [Escherichia coli]
MSLQKTPKSHEEVSHILSYVNPDCDNDTWVMTAFAVKSELGDSGQGIWVNWSQQSDKYDAGRAKSVWRG